MFEKCESFNVTFDQIYSNICELEFVIFPSLIKICQCKVEIKNINVNLNVKSKCKY